MCVAALIGLMVTAVFIFSSGGGSPGGWLQLLYSSDGSLSWKVENGTNAVWGGGFGEGARSSCLSLCMSLWLAMRPGISWGQQSPLPSPSLIQWEKRLKRSAEGLCQSSLPAPLPNTPHFYNCRWGWRKGEGEGGKANRQAPEKYTIFILHSISRFGPDLD